MYLGLQLKGEPTCLTRCHRARFNWRFPTGNDLHHVWVFLSPKIHGPPLMFYSLNAEEGIVVLRQGLPAFDDRCGSGDVFFFFFFFFGTVVPFFPTGMWNYVPLDTTCSFRTASLFSAFGTGAGNGSGRPR